MINSKKVFLGIFSLALFSSISYASAQEALVKTATTENVDNEAILFRINEITPILNADKNVYACDFSITFYNNTENNVTGASMDLTWEDNSLDSIISAEIKETLESNNRSRRGNSRTSKSNPSMISVAVEVPLVKSFQQSLIKTRIQSDRCFLLLNDPTMKVKSCRLTAPEGSNKARSSSENVCLNLFRYISPKAPEYYNDFKDMSAENDARKLTEKEKIKADIEGEYKKAIVEFDKATTSLNNL